MKFESVWMFCIEIVYISVVGLWLRRLTMIVKQFYVITDVCTCVLTVVRTEVYSLELNFFTMRDALYSSCYVQ